MLHGVRQAEKPTAPILFGAEELERYLPTAFLQKIEQVDKHYLAARKIKGKLDTDLRSMAGANKLRRAFIALRGLARLPRLGYHFHKAGKLGLAEYEVECTSGDPDIPGTYAKMFYNPEKGLPFIPGQETGCIDIQLGSFWKNTDGSLEEVGTDYDRCELNLSTRPDGITEGSLNIFRSIGMYVNEETGTRVSDDLKTAPTMEDFRRYSSYILGVLKDTSEGRFRNLREDRYASWKDPQARDIPGGLEPILVIQARREKWSGNPGGKGPTGAGN